MTDESREVRLEAAFRQLEQRVPVQAQELSERLGRNIDVASFALGQASMELALMTGQSLTQWLDSRPWVEPALRRALERIENAEG